MTTAFLPLDIVEVIPELQMRVAVRQDVVEDYAENIDVILTKAPIQIVNVEGRALIVDGFHRQAAATIAGKTEVNCEVEAGTMDIAFERALSANHDHGLRLTPDDKRKRAKLAIQRWPERSDRSLADICRVTHPFISRMRKTLEVPVTTSRVGMDGKTYTVKAGDATDVAGPPDTVDMSETEAPPPEAGETSEAGKGDYHLTLSADYEPARQLLGGFELDPASSKAANARIRAKRYFDGESIDGLAESWKAETVWCNPPYSNLSEWATKFFDEYAAGHFKHGVFFANANTADGWFQQRVGYQHAFCLKAGKRSFVDGHRFERAWEANPAEALAAGDAAHKGPHPPRTGQVWVYVGDRVQAFKRLFDPLGLVILPQPDGKGAYSTRKVHRGFCAMPGCGKACSTGKYCETCKQVSGRRDREWRPLVRDEVARCHDAKERISATRIATQCGAPGWRDVARLIVEEKLASVDVLAKLREQLNNAKNAVDRVEDWA